MKKILIILTFLITTLFSDKNITQDSYYYKGKLITLSRVVDTNKTVENNETNISKTLTYFDENNQTVVISLDKDVDIINFL